MANTKEGSFKTARQAALKAAKRQKNRIPTNNSSLGIRLVDIEEATKALVNVFYDGQTKELTFQRAPVSGGGGGGGALLMGTVLGGNSSNLNTPAATLEPGTFSFPVPLSEDGINVLANYLPEVNMWSAFDLTAAFRIGQALPVLPNGLCYIKLERPSSFAGFSWDAAYQATVTVQTETPPKFVAAYVSPGDSLKIIRVYFDRNLKPNGRPIGGIIVSDQDDNLFKVSTVSIEDNVLVITLKEDLVETDSYTISMPEGQYRSDGGEKPVAPTIEVDEENISYKGPRYTIAYAINRSALQTFYAGDLVFLVDKGLIITDSFGVTRPVVDILSNASNVRSPHSHLNPRFDQAGSAGPAFTVQ